MTKESVTIEDYTSGSHAITDTPVVVIFGVCTKRPIPPFASKWSLGWLPTGGAKNTVGTVWFSKESFLDHRLLHVLEDFNARTTVLPKFAGIVNGVWNCDITTWEQSEQLGKRGVRCQWKELESSPRYLEYVWEHKDDWAHENEATVRTDGVGEYTLGC